MGKALSNLLWKQEIELEISKGHWSLTDAEVLWFYVEKCADMTASM